MGREEDRVGEGGGVKGKWERVREEGQEKRKGRGKGRGGGG